ncbi:MAG: BON domain-containing protein [Actinomycetota bacterium]|nr:BON domain-containing protein [Actinomycetota bacterium]
MARRSGKGLTALVAGALGAAGAYFFDPDRGRSRRSRTRDQAAAALRRRQRETEARMRYAEGKLEGAAARSAGAGEFAPEDDTDIVHAIKQAFSGLEFSTTDVKVDVVGGTATLRGQVDEAAQIEEVQQVVAKVPGVVSVESYLHTPGTAPPNKAASLNAS